jgi:opacity protein-like surface antigen
MNRTTCLAVVALTVVPRASSATAAPTEGGHAIGTDRVERPEAKEDHRGAQPFWASLRGGYQVLDLTTFTLKDEKDFSADLVPTSASGPVGHLATGLRIRGFSLGARGSIMSLTYVSGGGLGGATLWSIDADLGLHVGAGSDFDPYLMLGAGYTAIGGLHPRGLDAQVHVRGYNTHLGLGFDYYVANNVAIGVLALGQVLFVTRPGVDARDLLTPKEVETLGEAKARALEADGSSVGTALSIIAGPSLHF